MTNGGAAAILAHDSILQQDERPDRQGIALSRLTPGPRKLSIRSGRPCA